MSYHSTSRFAESWVESVGKPLKPYLPAISRFLIVVTFYEDAVRIIYQWKDQLLYLERVQHFSNRMGVAFLALNVLAMLVCSTCIISKRWIATSAALLTTVILSQAIVYGFFLDIAFFLRNVSVTGGLLLCLSESILRRQKSNTMIFGSLPQLSVSDRHKYLQFAGRILLLLLFVGFVLNGEWGLLRATVSVVGMAACGMVVIGFRAKWSAMVLISLLCVMNVLVNNWWSRHHSNYTRDFLKYDFFQTLSIMGGLLLLISIGPGGLSYDEKKKEF